MTYVDGLSTALSAEYAAVFSYGTLGAQTSASAEPDLFAQISRGYNEHRAQRDQLSRMMVDQGADPPAAEPVYQLPGDLSSPELIRAAALQVERSVAEAYGYLVASASGRDRRWAIGALTQTAVRELTFRGTPEMFPGNGEYADR